MDINLLLLLHVSIAVIFAWLHPPNRKTFRHDKRMWNLLSSLVSISGIQDMIFRTAKQQPKFRMLSRTLPRDVQFVILTKQFQLPAWHRYLSDVFAAVWYFQRERTPNMGIVYLKWQRHQNAWYVGKHSACRRDHTGVIEGGFVSRLREHLEKTMNPKSSMGFCRLERRYKLWRQSPVQDACMIPVFWGTQTAALQYENWVMHKLDAPIQERLKKDSFQPAKSRFWPSQRQKKNIIENLELNLVPMFNARVQHDVSDFTELCRWTQSNHNKALLLCAV